MAKAQVLFVARGFNPSSVNILNGSGKRIVQIAGHWPSNSSDMLAVLYDEWQVSDELEKIGKDGLIFHTPLGLFATVGVDVAPIETVVSSAMFMNKALLQTGANIEAHEMALRGFDAATIKRIYAQYGSKYADWPKDLYDRYQAAYHAAHDVRQKLVVR